MKRNGYILIGVLVVTLILGAFDAPQFVNKVLDWKGGLFGLNLPHVPNTPFRLGLDLVGGTHLVYEADLAQIGGQSASEAMDGVRDVVERRVNIFGVAEPVVQVAGKNQLIVELAGISDVNEAIKLIGETPFLEFKELKPGANLSEGQEVKIDDVFIATGLNGKHLQRAQVVFDPNTLRPQVQLNLSEEGGKLFAQITKRNIGKQVAIYLDGVVISAPVVESEIANNQAVITGNFTPNEAKLLATRLNSGALPVPIKLVSQQTVGASLGAESLDKSLKAIMYGFLLVAIFMILFYRLPGFASILALVVYVVVVGAIYKFLPVTLTLAGIAGFILSLGIAVDANVLIFARMREEISEGKPLSVAMHEGFRRAWLSIRDSHVTTLIGAAGLYIFTTSIVKGFALTLSVGVLTSLFTATVVTRTILYFVSGPKWEKHMWLFK